MIFAEIQSTVKYGKELDLFDKEAYIASIENQPRFVILIIDGRKHIFYREQLLAAIADAPDNT